MIMFGLKMGYVVEFKKKEGFFDGYGKLQKVLMTGEKLAELLTQVRYYVISAKSVNIPEYQVDHSDDGIEVWL